jgi:hypothetical protein
MAQLPGAPTAWTGLERIVRISPTTTCRAFDQASIFCHRFPSVGRLRKSCARIGRLEAPKLMGFTRQGADGFWAAAVKSAVQEIKPSVNQS